MGRGILSEDVYKAVVDHLTAGTRPDASARKLSVVSNQAYMHLFRKDFELKSVNDPRSLSQDPETKLVLTGTDKIVLMEREIDQLIELYFKRSKEPMLKALWYDCSTFCPRY
jgi:hypothetical protein